MPTLETLRTQIKKIIKDPEYHVDSDLNLLINQLIMKIAAGIRMPDGSVSPPLPDLYTSEDIETTTLPYVAMPSTFHNRQKSLVRVADSNGTKILSPDGGDYGSFQLFLNRTTLAQTGSVFMCAVKGNNLYYQGIPASAQTLTLHFYRKPVDLTTGTEEPDGLPDHLALPLIKHGVCMEIFGEGLEDGEDNKGTGMKYHTAKFYEAMSDLVEFVGYDLEPEYFHTDSGGLDSSDALMVSSWQTAI